MDVMMKTESKDLENTEVLRGEWVFREKLTQKMTVSRYQEVVRE